MAKQGIAGINIYKDHAFIDSEQESRTIVGINEIVVENLYTILQSGSEDFVKYKPYAILSLKLMENALNLACIDLHRSVNFHMYSKGADETKYISRFCYYWLKTKPIQVSKEQPSHFIDDYLYVNERFICKALGSYIFSVLYKRIIDECCRTSDSQRLYTYFVRFQNIWYENSKSLELYFINHSITLHAIEYLLDNLLIYYRENSAIDNCLNV